MTQEEKELLIKDLCARLPYSVIVSIEIEGVKLNEPLSSINVSRELCTLRYSDGNWPIGMVTPYLRPMKSMTEDESNEIDKFKVILQVGHESYEMFNHVGYVDWLNAHHFDYNGLIPKGLALPAPEGMYEKEGTE